MTGHGPAKPVRLFYSYSHQDEDLRRKLETHLAALRRSGLIAEWHDRKLEPGDAWKNAIDRHLRSADIVLLLVSADFIASDYCWGEEMEKALARHRQDEALVIPVILRYCRWQGTPLGDLQAVPKNARPITAWPDQDEAFEDVVAAIERAVENMRPVVTPKAAVAKPSTGGPPPGFIEVPPGVVKFGFEPNQIRKVIDMIATIKGRYTEFSADNVREVLQNIPLSDVYLDGFWISETVITNAQFAEFVTATGHRTRAEGDPDRSSWRKHQERRDHPVAFVDHDDAMAYCAWRGGTLPTTEMWIRAYRGGDRRLYPWGDDYDPSRCNTVESCPGETTTSVHRFKTGVSPLGCHDMVGNVEEWTASRQGDFYGILGGSYADPCGVVGLPFAQRFARASTMSSDRGFRCVALRG